MLNAPTPSVDSNADAVLQETFSMTSKETVFLVKMSMSAKVKTITALDMLPAQTLKEVSNAAAKRDSSEMVSLVPTTKSLQLTQQLTDQEDQETMVASKKTVDSKSNKPMFKLIWHSSLPSRLL